MDFVRPVQNPLYHLLPERPTPCERSRPAFYFVLFSKSEKSEKNCVSPKKNQFSKDGVASFKINGWTLYSYDKLPLELEQFSKEPTRKELDDLLKGGDTELIKAKCPLIRIIAEKQMGNHNYCVYLDYRFGAMNRQILMCDDKWIGITEGNIGQMMAFAEYLNVHERFGIFEKLDGNAWLEISVME
ncbi:hypothetical protein [Treponema sp.]|uniref:hypothetical protein n=1 Tax=Treponema sp. TaxID=166 RepID=UPI00298DB104|nr:hypothetical protein [Treponema sp.]